MMRPNRIDFLIYSIITLTCFQVSRSFLSLPQQYYEYKTRLIKTFTRTSDIDSEAAITVSSNDKTGFEIPTLKNVKYRINQIVQTDKISAIKLRHIAVSTHEMAEQCKVLITSGISTFEELAQTTSLCSETKAKGGESNWIPMNAPDDDLSKPSYETIIPPEVINSAIYLNKGDMIITKSIAVDPITETSTSLFHLLQLIDIETRLTPSIIKKRRDNFLSLKGTSNKSINASNNQMTYFMETMGCQMNVADSERMQAQLSNLGYQSSNDSSSANIIVLNTCSVRDHAEQKVYSYVGPHAMRKRKGNPSY